MSIKEQVFAASFPLQWLTGVFSALKLPAFRENNFNQNFQNNIHEVDQQSREDVATLPVAVMTKMMKSDELSKQNAEAAFDVRCFNFHSLTTHVK